MTPIADAVKEVRKKAGTMSFISCKGKQMNTVLGVDYLPEDHLFELDVTKSTLKDVTLQKVFSI